MYSEEQLERVAQEQAKLVKKDIATLVDSQGRDRFIEGDIELIDDYVGTKLYGKWNLSGSHLLFVLALSFKNNDVITAGNCTKPINIPNWIKDKIVTLFGNSVDRQQVVFFGDDASTQSTNCYLQKSSNDITIYLGGITLTKDRQVRIAFDLLIDNE